MLDKRPIFGSFTGDVYVSNGISNLQPSLPRGGISITSATNLWLGNTNNEVVHFGGASSQSHLGALNDSRFSATKKGRKNDFLLRKW